MPCLPVNTRTLMLRRLDVGVDADADADVDVDVGAVAYGHVAVLMVVAVVDAVAKSLTGRVRRRMPM